MGPLDEGQFGALVSRALRHRNPVARMNAVRDLAQVARMDDIPDGRRDAAVEALERAATNDDYAAIRDTARSSLSGAPSGAAFEAWMRVARPEEAASFGEALQFAGALAEDGYASILHREADPRGEQSRRALRLLRALETARGQLDDAQKRHESRAVLLRLAERAVLDATDPSAAREARALLEGLRNEC